MSQLVPNYYGSLCAEMYEILHRIPPQDELNFYLSYAKKGDYILEPLCGNGRFLIPFIERGLKIKGIDASKEMLEKLKLKSPNASVVQSNIEDYSTKEKFDYIFIPSGSISLFTDISLCKGILHKIKNLLNIGGKFVFAADTVTNRCPNDRDYKISKVVNTKEGFKLVLKIKNYYDESTQTQFSPSIYELYDNEKILESEKMDFKTHLYKLGEMEEYLDEIGFTSVKTYSSFSKETVINKQSSMFIFECRF